jgi:hypothetical protein
MYSMKEIIQILVDPYSPVWRVFLILATVISIVWLILNFILQIVHKNIRASTIRKVGYPPAHCDGDGDMLSQAGTTKDKGISPIK